MRGHGCLRLRLGKTRLKVKNQLPADCCRFQMVRIISSLLCCETLVYNYCIVKFFCILKWKDLKGVDIALVFISSKMFWDLWCIYQIVECLSFQAGARVSESNLCSVYVPCTGVPNCSLPVYHCYESSSLFCVFGFLALVSSMIRCTVGN